MLISEKQQKANRENAQHSTGPITSEGKAAVRLNALTYGICARSLLLNYEDPDDYKQLHASLEAEWQPQTFTERVMAAIADFSAGNFQDDATLIVTAVL